MTTIVEKIADSISPDCPRLTTFKFKNPRMVHADFMTHRVLSRNASSSRATPVEFLAKASLEDMHVPKFRKNKPGMQPGLPLEGRDLEEAELIWKATAQQCAEAARKLAALGVHKQWANRPLEWFGHINVVVTATEWENFFNLRNELDENGFPVAQDEIYFLAQEMRRQLAESEPAELKYGEWHLPFVTQEEINQFEFLVYDDQITGDEKWSALIRISVARCARVSYLNNEGRTPSVTEDLKLYERLVGSRPMHASPTEHQATPDFKTEGHTGPYGEWRIERWNNSHLSGNLGSGWVQYRKTLPGEDGKNAR